MQKEGCWVLYIGYFTDSFMHSTFIYLCLLCGQHCYSHWETVQVTTLSAFFSCQHKFSE